MNYRKLGKTGINISEVSLGTWQVGGGWGGPFDEKKAESILNKAIDLGVNFIDTADVYDEGLSEKAVGKVVRERPEQVYVASKCGRRLNPHNAEGYNAANIRGFLEDSLRNTGLEQLDLLQLHCPPTEVYQKDEVFETLDQLKAEGKIAHYGVSVEKMKEALMAIRYPGVETVQLIFNMFRQKPTEVFFPEALKHDIGVIARVPLASGLLSGKFQPGTTFDEGDHRHFNRQGDAFDIGETFSGINFEQGILLVNKLQEQLGVSENLAQYAIHWVLMFEAVSCVIPGASKPEQVRSNVKSAELPHLSQEMMHSIKSFYDEHLRETVHPQW